MAHGQAKPAKPECNRRIIRNLARFMVARHQVLFLHWRHALHLSGSGSPDLQIFRP